MHDECQMIALPPPRVALEIFLWNEWGYAITITGTILLVLLDLVLFGVLFVSVDPLVASICFVALLRMIQWLATSEGLTGCGFPDHDFEHSCLCGTLGEPRVFIWRRLFRLYVSLVRESTMAECLQAQLLILKGHLVFRATMSGSDSCRGHEKTLHFTCLSCRVDKMMDRIVGLAAHGIESTAFWEVTLMDITSICKDLNNSRRPGSRDLWRSAP